MNQGVKMSEGVNLSDTGPKVLYIEDNAANIRLMEDIFSEFLSFELICANNAEDGIQMARDNLPGLILMDINMEGMNGYQALEIIKQDASISSIPAIAISADAMPDQIEEGIEKGFADYISKPFNVAKLIETINQRLA